MIVYRFEDRDALIAASSANAAALIGDFVRTAAFGAKRPFGGVDKLRAD
jgi:hypothetical protein